MQRIDRIGSRTEGPAWVVPVAAPRRVERRDPDAEERRRRQRPRPGSAAPARPEPVEPGHVDLTA
jgi:hypothetical protein